MNSVTDFFPVSNPAQVIRMIHPIDSKEPLSDERKPWPPKESDPLPPASKQTTLKLHVDPEQKPANLDEFQLDQPPTRQVEQLITHLREQQRELAQREADLQSQVYEWEKEVLAREGGLRRRTDEAEQQLEQISRQQDQLIRLQQSLVDSQDAIRAVLEKLVEECADEHRQLHLQKLRDEIEVQFDSNFRHWEELLLALTN